MKCFCSIEIPVQLQNRKIFSDTRLLTVRDISVFSGTELIICPFWPCQTLYHRFQRETAISDCNCDLIPLKNPRVKLLIITHGTKSLHRFLVCFMFLKKSSFPYAINVRTEPWHSCWPQREKKENPGESAHCTPTCRKPQRRQGTIHTIKFFAGTKAPSLHSHSLLNQQSCKSYFYRHLFSLSHKIVWKHFPNSPVSIVQPTPRPKLRSLAPMGRATEYCNHSAASQPSSSCENQSINQIFSRDTNLCFLYTPQEETQLTYFYMSSRKEFSYAF